MKVFYSALTCVTLCVLTISDLVIAALVLLHYGFLGLWVVISVGLTCFVFYMVGRFFHGR